MSPDDLAVGFEEPVVMIPDRIGDYRVERLLADGVLGPVYLVDSPRLPRREVLKVLREDLAADPAMRHRFEQEADITAGLEHPNVVRMYDRGQTADGQLWFTREYVAGRDAESALKTGGALAPARVLHIVTEVGRALDAAHHRGVVHQDIKPSNILLGDAAAAGEPERVVLTDFGSARPIDSATAPSGGPVAATLAYAAPEVITGDPVGARADVYSLGCTLFRLLTAHHPFPGHDDAADIVKAHLEGEPRRTSEYLAWATPQLDAVIATALAKDPIQRYPTAAALAAAAAHALAAPPAGRPVERPAPRPRAVPSAAADAPTAWSSSSAATEFIEELPRGDPGSSAAARRRLGIIAGVGAGAIAAALAVGTALSAHPPAPSSEPVAAPSSAPASVDPAAQAKLSALLPVGYPPGRCTAAARRDAQLAAASLTCGPNRDAGGPPAASYTLARDPASLQALFTSQTNAAAAVICPGNYASPGAWHRSVNPDVTVGTVFCGMRGDNRPMVAWTVDDKLLLAVIDGQSSDNPALDTRTLDQLYSWWGSHS